MYIKQHKEYFIYLHPIGLAHCPTVLKYKHTAMHSLKVGVTRMYAPHPPQYQIFLALKFLNGRCTDSYSLTVIHKWQS